MRLQMIRAVTMKENDRSDVGGNQDYVFPMRWRAMVQVVKHDSDDAGRGNKIMQFSPRYLGLSGGARKDRVLLTGLHDETAVIVSKQRDSNQDIKAVMKHTFILICLLAVRFKTGVIGG